MGQKNVVARGLRRERAAACFLGRRAQEYVGHCWTPPELGGGGLFAASGASDALLPRLSRPLAIDSQVRGQAGACIGRSLALFAI